MYRNYDYRPNGYRPGQSRKPEQSRQNIRQDQSPQNPQKQAARPKSENTYNQPFMQSPFGDMSDIRRQVFSVLAAKNPLLSLLLGGGRPDMSRILAEMMKKGGFM